MKTCSIKNCTTKHYARGWCKVHYERRKRAGHPERFLIIKGVRRFNDKGEKICTKCRLWLKTEEFRKQRTWCRLCRRLGRYGITRADYESTLKNQKGACALGCGRRPTDIDHDHITGRFRGLLCKPCNTALGVIGDSVDALRKAIAYLSNTGSWREEARHRPSNGDVDG